MILALVVEQWIGLGLLIAFAGFVIADLTHDQPSAEDGGEPREERE